MKPRKPPNPRSATSPRPHDTAAPEKSLTSPRRPDALQKKASAQSDRRKISTAKPAPKDPNASDLQDAASRDNHDPSIVHEKYIPHGNGRSQGSSTVTSNGLDESRKTREETSEAGAGRDFRETRTRKAKTTSTAPVGKSLKAVDKRGREFTVKLILANQPYVHETGAAPSSPENFLGHDGNQYYCQVCRGFGDVVCCDGCPRVYHKECVPLHSLSRESLDNDDDPWFCPKCIEKSDGDAPTGAKGSSKTSGKKGAVKARRTTRGTDKGDRTSSQRRCTDCQEIRSDLSLAPCTACGTYVHSPSCNGQPQASKKLLCFNCRAIDEDKGTDDGNENVASMSHEDVAEDDEGDMDTDDRLQASDAEDDDGDYEADVKRLKRKKASILPPSDAAALEKKLKKKKKKKRKRSMSMDVLEEDDEAARQQAIKDDPILKPRASGTVQAIPAFCFYLAENRWKLERALSRKHRTFNRLPKGDERNALVAQEAAVWWTKLSQTEHQHYINLSMRDFEARIILWKEEKTAREMGLLEDTSNVEANADSKADAASDRILTYEMHERLFLSTSVGSKPFKLEADQSYNRVLLELLHDIRFHPLPMFGVNRPEGEGGLDDPPPKVTIPFFEVHGPISTSIGDECLGCSRGWNHYCPVIQERVPAVEHRGRLQSPLSSLMATRVGLGLRPRECENDGAEPATMPVGDNLNPLFRWKESEDTKELICLPVVPSASLFDPSDRADEMVLFIEETAAMKIPEPPRPPHPDESKQKKANQRSLPTQKQRDPNAEDETGESLLFNKCGRCRTIIANDTGCVQCRRAQLVINKSKKVQAGSTKGGADGKSLKVHPTMLARVQVKDGSNEGQALSDWKVSEAMLKERWCPIAILPPKVMYTPSPKYHDPVAESDDDDVEMEESDDTAMEDVAPESESTGPDELQSAPTLNGIEPTEEAESDALPAKRSRSARSMSLAVKESVEPEPDRQQLLKHFKKETSEIQKKTTQIACYSILHALMRRDPLKIFEHPVSAEGYAAVVQNPIDFCKIQENVLAGKYATLNAFVADANLLCENALAYNPPNSIYFKTAKEMQSALSVMQTRAADWMSVVKGAYSKYLQRKDAPKRDDLLGVEDVNTGDPFAELRKTKPEAVRMLETGEHLRRSIASDFMRTKENEIAFYGCLAIRRVAAAAEASLAPYPDSHGVFSVVAKRKHHEDEELRDHVDAKVGAVDYPQLKDVSTWREESVVRLVRKVQKLRLEKRSTSESGCSRCDGTLYITADKKSQALYYDITNPVRPKKKAELVTRVAADRIGLATGLASANTCQRIANKNGQESNDDSVGSACVSVRGSKVHGMGVFADQPFNKGDVVAEYMGEYVVHSVADKREKQYGEQRIQDYLFRLDDKWVIDATTKGGWARYINHSCNPNCKTTIIPGKEPSPHLRRVLIIAQRKIELNEEISYDYQFPLELDLRARIPCNCQADNCRGFMNWDLPEKGSNNRALLVQKRGANMRDRIRRLGRPLKRDEV